MSKSDEDALADWERCLDAGLTDLYGSVFTASNSVARALLILQTVLSLCDPELEPGGAEASDMEHELNAAARALRNVARAVKNRRLLLKADHGG